MLLCPHAGHVCPSLRHAGLAVPFYGADAAYGPCKIGSKMVQYTVISEIFYLSF